MACQFDRVDFAYPSSEGRPVVADLDFTIAAGERVAIVGPSGAGKSTLLRIIAKIYAPATGTVTWAPGVTVSLLSLGLGFKNELTGRDNAYLAGLLQGLTKNDAKQSLVSIEAFCELGDYFDDHHYGFCLEFPVNETDQNLA